MEERPHTSNENLCSMDGIIIDSFGNQLLNPNDFSVESVGS